MVRRNNVVCLKVVGFLRQRSVAWRPMRKTSSPNLLAHPAGSGCDWSMISQIGTHTNMKTVYTTGEAAKICKVSQQTIIRCFDSGQLKGFRVPDSGFGEFLVRRLPLHERKRDSDGRMESGRRWLQAVPGESRKEFDDVAVGCHRFGVLI